MRCPRAVSRVLLRGVSPFENDEFPSCRLLAVPVLLPDPYLLLPDPYLLLRSPVTVECPGRIVPPLGRIVPALPCEEELCPPTFPWLPLSGLLLPGLLLPGLLFGAGECGSKPLFPPSL